MLALMRIGQFFRIITTGNLEDVGPTSYLCSSDRFLEITFGSEGVLAMRLLATRNPGI